MITEVTFGPAAQAFARRTASLNECYRLYGEWSDWENRVRRARLDGRDEEPSDRCAAVAFGRLQGAVRIYAEFTGNTSDGVLTILREHRAASAERGV
jgi:hypothetical protein